MGTQTFQLQDPNSVTQQLFQADGQQQGPTPPPTLAQMPTTPAQGGSLQQDPTSQLGSLYQQALDPIQRQTAFNAQHPVISRLFGGSAPQEALANQADVLQNLQKIQQQQLQLRQQQGNQDILNRQYDLYAQHYGWAPRNNQDVDPQMAQKWIEESGGPEAAQQLADYNNSRSPVVAARNQFLAGIAQQVSSGNLKPDEADAKIKDYLQKNPLPGAPKAFNSFLKENPSEFSNSIQTADVNTEKPIENANALEEKRQYGQEKLELQHETQEERERHDKETEQLHTTDENDKQAFRSGTLGLKSDELDLRRQTAKSLLYYQAGLYQHDADKAQTDADKADALTEKQEADLQRYTSSYDPKKHNGVPIELDPYRQGALKQLQAAGLQRDRAHYMANQARNKYESFRDRLNASEQNSPMPASPTFTQAPHQAGQTLKTPVNNFSGHPAGQAHGHAFRPRTQSALSKIGF